jgi:hypothetical protein
MKLILHKGNTGVFPRYIPILIFLFLHCEDVKIEWKIEYEPAGPGIYIINDLDGFENFFTVGMYEKKNQNPVGIIAKYNPQGKLKWFKLFEDRNFRMSEGQRILVTKENFLHNEEMAYLLVSGFDTSNKHYLRLVKYDSLGNTQWGKFVRESTSEISGAIIKDYSDNIWIGSWNRNSASSDTIFINKYSSSGTSILAKKCPLKNFHVDNLKFATTKSNELIAGGVCKVCHDFFFILFDSLGELNRLVKYESPSVESSLSDLKIDNQGNIYLTGIGWQEKSGNDWITIVYDKSGHLLWSQTYDGEKHGNDVPRAMIIDESLSVYITGCTETDSGVNSILTVKYDRYGDLIWSRKFSGDNNMSIEPHFFEADFFCLKKEDLLDFLYIIGLMNNKIYLLKYDRYGNLIQRGRYNLRALENTLQAQIGPLIAFQSKDANRSRTYLLKFGRFQLLGISRWD